MAFLSYLADLFGSFGFVVLVILIALAVIFYFGGALESGGEAAAKLINKHLK